MAFTTFIPPVVQKPKDYSLQRSTLYFENYIVVAVLVGTLAIAIAIVIAVSHLFSSGQVQIIKNKRVHVSKPSTEYHSDTTNECDSVIQKYSSSLSTLYKKQLIVDDKLNFVTFEHYVSLVIVKRQKVDSREEINEITRRTLHGGPDDIMQVKEPMELDDLFKPITSNETIEFILISGAPGIGKSTLSLHIARNWQTITNYTLAILVRLRERKAQYAEKIQDLFIEGPDMTKVIDCIEKADGQNVLWILDGFDELPAQKQDMNSESIYHQLCLKRVLPLSTVIVTSRHSSTTELVQYLGSHSKSKHVEIVGFNKEQIHRYATLAFKNDKVKLSKFTAYYSQNPVILSLMYVPLNTAIVSFVFRKRFDNSKPFPHTMTGLYSSLVCNLMRRHTRKNHIPQRIMTEDDIQKLPIEWQESFHNLTELAYNGIVDDEYIFSDQPNNFSHFDLMNKVTSLGEEGDTQYTYNFFHTTLQEYMAAIYISQSSLSYLVETVKHKEVVMTFYFGISSQLNSQSTNSTALNVAYSHDSEISIRLLYEFPNYAYPISIQHFYYGATNIRPSDFYIAGYLISNFGVSVNCVILEYKYHSDIEMFLNGLDTECKNSLGTGKVTELTIECREETDSEMNSSTALVNLFNSSQFFKNAVSLSFYENFCLNLTKAMIPTPSTFKNFKVYYSESVNSTDEAIYESIVNSNVITEVFLKEIILSDQIMQQLVVSSSIRSLHLSSQNFSNVSETVLQSITDSKNLSELYLDADCTVSTEFLQAVLSRNITHLEVSSIDSQQYTEILDILFEPSSLIYLGIPLIPKANKYEYTGLSTNHNIKEMTVLVNSLENISNLVSAIVSRDNSLETVYFVIRFTLNQDECLKHLAEIITRSTAPLHTMSIDIKGNVLGSFTNHSPEILMKLIEAKKNKPLFNLILGESLHLDVPDQYSKDIKLLVPTCNFMYDAF